MSRGMNKQLIIGRIGQDPEGKDVGEEHRVVKFSVAVPRRGNKDETDWFHVEARNKVGKFVESYLKKGALVHVNGPMICQKYQGQDGEKKSFWKLQADEVISLESKPREEYPNPEPPFPVS